MAAGRQLVLFKVGGQTFGVEIELVKEIIAYQDVTPVPDSYEFVEGITSLHGKIVTVIDMRKRLRAPLTWAEKSTRILILEIDKKIIGLIVDAASEIVRVADEMIGPPPELISEAGASYIKGVARMGERTIVLLDLKLILSPNEVGRLDELIGLLYNE